MEILYISYGEFSRSTVRAVQELYRSSLVCPLILIRRATFWCKRLEPYSPGKYVNWNLSFSMGDSCTLAMENFQGQLYGRTGTVQVKSGMSIDSHLERCLLVQTAELYSPGKYVNWNLSFFNGKPMIAMENFQSDLYGRTGTVQVKSGMSIDSHLERCLLVQTARAVQSWEVC